MTNEPAEPLSLSGIGDELLAQARGGTARRAAQKVYGRSDSVLHQTLIALAQGGELAAHDAPPEATLQVLVGRIVLTTEGRDQEASAGDLLPIPSERHGVNAPEDSVFLLTVRRDLAT